MENCQHFAWQDGVDEFCDYILKFIFYKSLSGKWNDMPIVWKMV